MAVCNTPPEPVAISGPSFGHVAAVPPSRHRCSHAVAAIVSCLLLCAAARHAAATQQANVDLRVRLDQPSGELVLRQLWEEVARDGSRGDGNSAGATSGQETPARDLNNLVNATPGSTQLGGDRTPPGPWHDPRASVAPGRLHGPGAGYGPLPPAAGDGRAWSHGAGQHSCAHPGAGGDPAAEARTPPFFRPSSVACWSSASRSARHCWR